MISLLYEYELQILDIKIICDLSEWESVSSRLSSCHRRSSKEILCSCTMDLKRSDLQKDSAHLTKKCKLEVQICVLWLTSSLEFLAPELRNSEQNPFVSWQIRYLKMKMQNMRVRCFEMIVNEYNMWSNIYGVINIHIMWCGARI